MLELQVPRGPVQPPRPTGRRVAEVGEEPQKGLWEKGFFLSSGGSHQVGRLGGICVPIGRESRWCLAIRPWRPRRLGASSSRERPVKTRGGEGAETPPSGALGESRDGGRVRAGPGPGAGLATASSSGRLGGAKFSRVSTRWRLRPCGFLKPGLNPPESAAARHRLCRVVLVSCGR